MPAVLLYYSEYFWLSLAINLCLGAWPRLESSMPVFLGMSVTDCQLSLFIMRFQGFEFYTERGFLGGFFFLLFFFLIWRQKLWLQIIEYTKTYCIHSSRSLRGSLLESVEFMLFCYRHKWWSIIWDTLWLIVSLNRCSCCCQPNQCLFQFFFCLNKQKSTLSLEKWFLSCKYSSSSELLCLPCRKEHYLNGIHIWIPLWPY